MIAGNILADYFNPIRGTTGDMLLIAQVPKIANIPSAILPKSGNHIMNNLKTGKSSMCERGERGEREGRERGERGERGERRECCLFMFFSVLPHIHTFEAIPGSSRQNIVGKSGALQCTFSYSVR